MKTVLPYRLSQFFHRSFNCFRFCDRTRRNTVIKILLAHKRVVDNFRPKIIPRWKRFLKEKQFRVSHLLSNVFQVHTTNFRTIHSFNCTQSRLSPHVGLGKLDLGPSGHCIGDQNTQSTLVMSQFSIHIIIIFKYSWSISNGIRCIWSSLVVVGLEHCLYSWCRLLYFINFINFDLHMPLIIHSISMTRPVAKSEKSRNWERVEPVHKVSR
jgi:hypothetical protein